MANIVEVKLKKSWKHGIPSLGKTIIYGGRKYQVNLDDPDVKRDYEFYKGKGAFEDLSKKQTKKPPQEPPVPPEPPVETELQNPTQELPQEEPKAEEEKPKSDPATKQGKQGKK